MSFPNYNIDEFFSRLESAIKDKDLFKVELGKVREFPILLLKPKVTVSGPRILLSAGFHGDEISGPWAVLKFLEEYHYPTEINLSILPLVNPTGFQLSRRGNFWGVQPNNDYVDIGEYQEASQEDKILKKNKVIFKVLAKDAYIALHEDDEEKFYIYSIGKFDQLDKKLLEIGEEYFGVLTKDQIKNKNKGGKKNTHGRVGNDLDASFEHFLYENGTKKAITVEIPSRQDFDRRVQLALKIILIITNEKYY